MTKGKGFGKVILFGEHFVVYGLPGIASGIDKYVEVDAEKIKDSKELVFDDKIFKEKFSMTEQPEHIKSKLFHAMFDDELDITKEGVKLLINGTATPGGGMGYSAALSVAMARAMSDFSGSDWKDDKVNSVAYKGECVSHGTPSGIDNTCATYGTLVWFEKNMKGGPNNVKPFKCGKTLFLVVADTGVKHDTKEAVASVRKRKEENEEEFKKYFSDAKKIVTEAKKELQFGGIKQIGKLMNDNQELLRKIGVSCKEAEEIIKIAEYENSIGAKVTGAGCGGNVIILCENENSQDKIISTLTNKNYSAIKTKIR
jgi:mevalonate kinase